MQSRGPPVYVFKSHAQAEKVVHGLSKASFDVTKLSIIGKGYHTEEDTKGDRMKAWSASGAFWGGPVFLAAALRQAQCERPWVFPEIRNPQ